MRPLGPAVGDLVTGLSAFAVFFAFLGFFVVVVVVEAAFFESISVAAVEVCVWVKLGLMGMIVRSRTTKIGKHFIWAPAMYDASAAAQDSSSTPPLSFVTKFSQKG
jgi:hypothetical protein